MFFFIPGSLKFIKSGKSRFLESNQTSKEIKIADSVLLSLFLRDNEKFKISHAYRTDFSGIQFPILNDLVLGSLSPKDQKNIKYKYNII